MNQVSDLLKEVDLVEILIVIDNYMDVLLTNTQVITRPPLAKGGDIPSDSLLAEHGLSMLVTVYEGKEKHAILFDTGYNKIGVPHNLEQLKVDLRDIEAIVLSHGHMDHTGALYAILDKISGTIPILLHPGAFAGPRYFGLADGRKLLFPQTLVKEELIKRNVELIENKTPTLLARQRIMVTGEVDRVTPFEKGLPNAVLERDGKIEKDPIADDQALVINLKGKGLVIIAGCSHAGIINTIFYAQKLTGIEKVHAIVGGFHLSGPYFEQIIEQTINEFKDVSPEVLVPMHCTGWKAIKQISQEFPDAFVLSSVGSTITLS